MSSPGGLLLPGSFLYFSAPVFYFSLFPPGEELLVQPDSSQEVLGPQDYPQGHLHRAVSGLRVSQRRSEMCTLSQRLIYNKKKNLVTYSDKSFPGCTILCCSRKTKAEDLGASWGEFADTPLRKRLTRTVQTPAIPL